MFKNLSARQNLITLAALLLAAGGGAMAAAALVSGGGAFLLPLAAASLLSCVFCALHAWCRLPGVSACAHEALRLSAIAFESREGIVVTDAKGCILMVNHAFSLITGFSGEKIKGKASAALCSPRHGRFFYRDVMRCLSLNGSWQGELWIAPHGGGERPCYVVMTVVRDAVGRIAHHVISGVDISERVAAEHSMRRMAYHDSLTQLPNRHSLMEGLTRALGASARSGQYGAVLFLDLDQFKQLNDTRGHDVGDQLLVKVAARLRLCVRSVDTVSRFGGDEFVVVLENLGCDELAAAAHVRQVAEKIRATLEGHYLLDNCSHHNSSSIGVSLFHGQGAPEETILKQADLALYQAKGDGRNAVRFFSPAVQHEMTTRLALEQGLRRALYLDQFVLLFQPQVAADGSLIGAEALLRWRCDGNTVLPERFIPLAEETGLIMVIGQTVLASACRQLQAWHHSGMTLAVNISERQFRHPDFVAQVQQALAQYGVLPAALTLEVSESTLLADIGASEQRMAELKSLGVGLSIDDFGSGPSSLSSLGRFPLDQLKIHRSVVEGLTAHPDGTGLISAILAVGRSLQIDVFAAGVETDAQRDYLRASGCRGFQGYLIAPPLEVEAFDAMAQA
ncbi:putative bifunctional diguanylate cyclase/phosphodiesterase [Paludibacterium yongneupense]|uniref:putative bifunctional diguanylate cyclase/phosphodiesterase n=1 Tax=Paludibacterium yongneupense TaxID=400061 RepID=UPI001B7FD8D5|nr:EAL domain-containing protein [Paludibacterium yongneupense]